MKKTTRVMYDNDTRMELSRLAVWIPVTQHKALRLLAHRRDVPLHVIVSQALSAHMEKK